MKHQEKQWASILCVFLASVCFSLGGLFIKLVPWQALAINGARNLIGWFLLRYRDRARHQSGHPGDLRN